jgi:uncharacterized membrane protein YkoI
MRRALAAILAGTFLTLAAVGPAAAQEQDDVFRAVRSGSIMPLDQIDRMVRQRLGGAELIGQDFDPVNMVYKLRYQQSNGQIVDVWVDARTGQMRR